MNITDGVNYEGLTNRSLTFNSSINDITVNVSIFVTNETVHGIDEEFNVSLSFLGGPIPGVSLEPVNAAVTIFEANGEGNSILTAILHLM